MRLRHIQGAEETIASSPFVIQEPEQHRGTWNQVFGGSHPLEIEVGMGKGRFIMEKASANPDINYIGIERYSSVLLRGLQKRSEMDLENIYFMCIDAKDMAEIAMPSEGSHPLSLCLYTTKFWRPRVLLNSRQITAGCLNIPWNPFQMPAGRLQSIPLIFTTAPWQKEM